MGQAHFIPLSGEFCLSPQGLGLPLSRAPEHSVLISDLNTKFVLLPNCPHSCGPAPGPSPYVMPFLELEKQWDLREMGTRPLSHTATDRDLSPALCGRTGQLLPSPACGGDGEGGERPGAQGCTMVGRGLPGPSLTPSSREARDWRPGCPGALMRSHWPLRSCCNLPTPTLGSRLLGQVSSDPKVLASGFVPWPQTGWVRCVSEETPQCPGSWPLPDVASLSPGPQLSSGHEGVTPQH